MSHPKKDVIEAKLFSLTQTLESLTVYARSTTAENLDERVIRMSRQLEFLQGKTKELLNMILVTGNETPASPSPPTPPHAHLPPGNAY